MSVTMRELVLFDEFLPEHNSSLIETMEDAVVVFTQHCLSLAHRMYDLDYDWAAVLDNAKRRAGQCRYRKQEIGISRLFISWATHEQIVQTVLHEIAHALAFELDDETGHGWSWRRWCRELGIEPERCTDYHDDVPLSALGNYAAICPDCPIGTRIGFRWKKPNPNRLYFCKQHDRELEWVDVALLEGS